jgi:hypothetical protein
MKRGLPKFKFFFFFAFLFAVLPLVAKPVTVQVI